MGGSAGIAAAVAAAEAAFVGLAAGLGLPVHDSDVLGN